MADARAKVQRRRLVEAAILQTREMDEEAVALFIDRGRFDPPTGPGEPTPGEIAMLNRAYGGRLGGA